MVQLKRRPKGKSTKQAAKEVVVHAQKKEEPKDECTWIDPYNLIPSGSTVLNCALSDHYQGGYQVGTIINTVGDSGTGKTLLALNCLAEMTLHKRFDDYRFIFDDIEAALAGNIKQMFGSEVAERIELTTRSSTIQDLYINLLKAIKEGQPFVYIPDSLDALTSKEEQARANKMLTGKEKKEETGEKKKETGSYKMEKAKLISEILRVITREIKDKEAFVNVISQTRDNIGWGFTDKTRSGGKGLKFYCYHEMWVSSAKPITKGGDKIKIGSNSQIQISKNKLTFKKRNIEIPIYDHFGIDDVGSCVDFLVSQKVWSKPVKSTTITAEHFGWEGTRESIIKRVEHHDREQELRQLVGLAWCNKEDSLVLNRKKRYK